MGKKALSMGKRYENNTKGTNKILKSKDKINKINKLIVELEFDNRQLRIECIYLRSRLEQLIHPTEYNEIPF
jgi:regulator of replication initiation timing